MGETWSGSPSQSCYIESKAGQWHLIHAAVSFASHTSNSFNTTSLITALMSLLRQKHWRQASRSCCRKSKWSCLELLKGGAHLLHNFLQHGVLQHIVDGKLSSCEIRLVRQLWENMHKLGSFPQWCNTFKQFIEDLRIIKWPYLSQCDVGYTVLWSSGTQPYNRGRGGCGVC